MAWEEKLFENETLTTGDKPIDEMALALARIATHYDQAFSRKPTVSELRYAFEHVLRSQSGKYTLGSSGPGELATPPVQTSPARHESGPGPQLPRYQASFVDVPEPGHYAIHELDARGQEAECVVRVRPLEVEDRRLVCRYASPPNMTDFLANHLIRTVLLQEFCDNYYAPLADEVVVERVPTV